ncbi:MAG: prepilin-type N-terminal cleavage/methylation domain-containing protein, partial [Candidatus Omnitrophota bacterium]
MFGKNVSFTMVELLVCVAVLAILTLLSANIFVGAKIRAEAVRVRADFRIVGQAIETYILDCSVKPFFPLFTPFASLSCYVNSMRQLTTP